MNYSVTGFRYRWFVENCGIIELPNGKVIVIDPMFLKDESAMTHPREKGFISGFDDSVVTRCDYILLTHIHFDHTASLKALQERFKCPILVNGWSSFALIKELDLPGGCTIPMTDGCEYNFDDFRILWQQGRHTLRIGEFRPSTSEFDGDFDGEARDYLFKGTAYNSNFIIKLNNGMSIAMDGGAHEPHLNEFEKHHPTLILHHASRDVEQCTKEAAEQLSRGNSPYMFFQTMQIMPDKKANVAEVNENLAKMGISGRVVYAEPGEWVTFGAGACVGE